MEHIKRLETKPTETITDQNCEDVNQYFSILISDIQQFRTKVNSRLDELEKKVREEAEKIKNSDSKSMESISTEIECMQKHLSKMSST